MGGRSRRLLRRRLLLFVSLVAGCATSSGGIVHVVQRGENLYRIGKAYGIEYHELARQNGIDDPGKIEVGQEIFIPGASRHLPVEIITPRSVSLPAREVPRMPPGGYGLRWPMQSGRVTSGFGPRNGSFHDGIDISAPEGTPVYAAARGRVIYSDHIPGYGNIVIVDHGGGLSTVYAHNSRNDVREGEDIEAGQIVGHLGDTGRTTGPNLHFEVRRENVATDPLAALPSLP